MSKRGAHAATIPDASPGGAGSERSIRQRLGTLPPWAIVLGIYLAARVFTTIALLVFAQAQDANVRVVAHPDFFTYSAIWDGQWFQFIAGSGYPKVLPLGTDGYVAENAWAFYPGFPFLVRGLEIITGLPFAVLGSTVSFLCGIGATQFFYRYIRRFLPQSSSYFAVLLVAIGPTSVLFQTAYSESLSIMLLAAVLLLVAERRWAWAIPVLVTLAFTRPVALPLALFFALHAATTWLKRHRARPSAAELAWPVGLAALSTALGFAWPLIAALVTGRPNAYVETEMAWQTMYTHTHHVVPFAALFAGAQFWFGQVGGILIAIAATVLLLAWVLLSRSVRATGTDVQWWSVSYTLYLAAVFLPQSSIWRMLMPLFPLAGALARPKSPWYRVPLVALCLIGQIVWIRWCWYADPGDWSPP